MNEVYLAGSLRNEGMLDHFDFITELGYDTFMDWYAVGPKADDYWKEYWQRQGVSYKDALSKPNSQNIFEFDKKHIDAAKVLVLAQPAGKSGHLELGYHIGRGKPGIYFFPEETDIRWDVMTSFATEVCVGYNELQVALAKHLGENDE